MTSLPSSTVLPLTSRHRRRRSTLSQNGSVWNIFGILCPLLDIFPCCVAIQHHNSCKPLFAMSFRQEYCEQHPQQRYRSYRFDCFLYFPRSLQLVDDFVHIGDPKLVGLSMSTWDHVRLAFGVDWSDHIRQLILNHYFKIWISKLASSR